MTDDGIAESLTARAICEMVELRIGVLSPKPGDVVVLQVTDAKLMQHLPPMVDWLKRIMPQGVECVLVGPNVNFSILTKARLDANATAKTADA